VAYKAKGQLDLALADADKACEADPRNPENFVARAITYMTKGDRARAGRDVDTVLKLDPTNKQGAFLRQQLSTPDAVAAKASK
jgi:Tfp pilus assembly protein PilF